MHQPSPLAGSEKRPTLQPLSENCEYAVGVSKYRHEGAIKPLNDVPIKISGSCQMTPEQEQLMSEAVVLL
ncbi:hypothetical protein [Psychrobacter sp. AT9]|uniref:hypothetical protein n=1 Tax=Psychrobacter sp. AT9 TaxID=3242893 RepID=UPI0039A52F8F